MSQQVKKKREKRFGRLTRLFRNLQQRMQLLSDTELRNLVTIPFATPSTMNANALQARVNGTRPTSVTPTNSQVKGVSSLPMKRQNSRTKMTPQQAAVAMANGMIAANMAAVVNGNQGKAMQMALAAHQKQQQQQQQQTSSPHVS